MFTRNIVVQSSLLWQHCALIIYKTEKTDSREQHRIIPIKSPQTPNPQGADLCDMKLLNWCLFENII